MAISRIGAAAVDGTTITIPAGHQNGDLLIIYAFSNGATVPSLPAGWTSLNTSTSAATAMRCGWKLAISGADTSGTWTNATGLICQVYRNVATNKTPVAANASSGAGTSTTVNYAGIIPIKCPGTSWFLAFAATKTLDSTIETAPTNLTNVVNTIGAAVEYAGFDSNGPYVPGSWPDTNVSVGGTSAGWRTYIIEIYAEQLNIENYKGFDVGNGMSVGEKIY